MTDPTSAFGIEAVGPFDFGQSLRFLEAWTPAGGAATQAASIQFAYCSETDWEPLAVSVTGAPGGVQVRVSPPVGGEVQAEIGRMFSLDVDGTSFAEVGRLDPLVGELQAQRRGLRPVCFWSPWEATVWAILSQRTSMQQAARAKARMADELGDAVSMDGQSLRAFPSPARFLEQSDRVRQPEAKLRWLCGLVEAALDGRIEAAHLRSLTSEEAIAELRKLEGVGPFSAALIAARGAGHPDLFTSADPRLARRMQAAYGSAADVEAITDAWRPFRSWCSFLIRSANDAQLMSARRRGSGGGGS